VRDIESDIALELTMGDKVRAGINLSNFLLVSGADEEGKPTGVAPDMAKAIGGSLGYEVEMVCFPSPGVLADAASKGAWDIGLIAAEPARAELIKFTSAYVEIEATYMVRRGLDSVQLNEIDRPEIKIGVADRSAYELYLTRTLKSAELVRGKGLPGAIQLFVDAKVDVLAGLRPALLDDSERLDGRVLEGCFTTVQQAIGTLRSNKKMAKHLTLFVESAKKNGLVGELIKKHGMEGRLLVAA
jgi:polar amino acid transport system substrate-binding protein